VKPRRSLRLRVAVGMAALAILTVGVHSFLLFSATDRMEENLVDRIVGEELQHFIVKYRDDHSLPPPVSEKLAGYFAPDAAARGRLPESVRDLGPGLHEIFVQGEERHVAVRDEPEGRFIMVYDVEHHEERERGFITLLLLGAGVTVLAAGTLGYWAAGWLVRPVRALAHRVERLGPRPPETPLAQQYADEEVQHLARAFDGYLAKIAEFIQREQEFTDNVSHELRTPLTAIRTSCELLLQDAGLSEASRRRVEAIDRAALRLTETARALLYLGRGAHAPHAEEIPVRECIVEAAEQVQPVLSRKQVACEIDIDPAAMVRADRTALLMVVDNLLRNAATYTERGRVRVAYRDGRLLIEDSGPGIDAAILPRLGERFYRGAQEGGLDGTGLGLAIVKRICERLGWRFEIESVAGRGTRASVGFPLPSSQELHAPSTGP
jgi:signal transduction histidine kinase